MRNDWVLSKAGGPKRCGTPKPGGPRGGGRLPAGPSESAWRLELASVVDMTISTNLAKSVLVSV